MGKSQEIKYMDISEFRKMGLLQEVNRRFFHPMGLALEVKIDEEGNESLGGIWDYRDDPEGIHFDPTRINETKIKNVDAAIDAKSEVRIKMFGNVIQQPKE